MMGVFILSRLESPNNRQKTNKKDFIQYTMVVIKENNRGRGVVWSSLRASGALDPGSNPGAPML